MKVMVIGLAGGTGSGKTTLAKNIAKHFGNDISMLRHDDYYKRHDDIPLSERAKLNYDHPDAFDKELLHAHVEMLKNGKAVDSPIYDYTTHNRSDKTRHVPATPVVVIEGILVFEDAELCNLMDMKIFVDTDADVRILRRLLRDVKERGRTLDSVIGQYLSTVKPMHEAFVEPSKRYADIIVPVGGENAVACQMIIDRIEKHLN
jgi:uridine kinase